MAIDFKQVPLYLWTRESFSGGFTSQDGIHYYVESSESLPLIRKEIVQILNKAINVDQSIPSGIKYPVDLHVANPLAYRVGNELVAELLEKGVNSVRTRDPTLVKGLHIWGNRFIVDQRVEVLVAHKGTEPDFTDLLAFAFTRGYLEVGIQETS